jgi:prolipoprotein diacylglyceryltransferase
MFPVLQIGPLALRTPGLLLLAGAFLGLSLAERHAARRGLHPDRMYSLVMIMFLVGILGARLSFAARHPGAFRDSPINLVSLDLSLLDPFGGLALALVAGLVYGQKKGLAFWSMLDAFTPALAVFAVFLGLSHLAGGTAFGAPTSLPWAIELWGARRHPSQIYETLAALAILAILWRRFGIDSAPGRLFLQFIALSAGAALFLGAFRGDNLLLPGGLRLDQVLAWAVLALSLGLLERQSAQSRKSLPAEKSPG